MVWYSNNIAGISYNFLKLCTYELVYQSQKVAGHLHWYDDCLYAAAFMKSILDTFQYPATY